MSGKKRHTVTTIETHEFWILKSSTSQQRSILCHVCGATSEMLTAREAAVKAGVTERTVYRWVEDGRVHFAENERGDLLICLAPLSV